MSRVRPLLSAGAAMVLMAFATAVLAGCGSSAAPATLVAPTAASLPLEAQPSNLGMDPGLPSGPDPASGQAAKLALIAGPAPLAEPLVSTAENSAPAATPASVPVAATPQKPPVPETGDSEQKGGSSVADPVEGQTYTWEDGDRTLTVRLQSGLTVQEDGGSSSEGDIVARAGEGSIVAKDSKKDGAGDGAGNSNDGEPVFRSVSGALMTPPAGVLLALNEEWGSAETDAFFANNGINLNRVSELSYLINGFFVETEPGFPSLELANSLAALDGVVVSSPNWWTGVSAK